MTKEDKQAALERLEITKNSTGPMKRSTLVHLVCQALLASGALRGYTFGYTSDAPTQARCQQESRPRVCVRPELWSLGTGGDPKNAPHRNVSITL